MLTVRDREIVEWVGRLGAVGPGHVMARFGMGRTAAYRRIAVLIDHRLLISERLLHGAPGLLVASRDGLMWTGLAGSLDVCRVAVSQVTHWQTCADIALVLEREFGASRVQSDREVRAIERHGLPSPSALLGGAGSPRRHRPDLAITTPSREGWALAVEVELSVKAPRRLEAICRGYARNRQLAGVRYYATPATARAVRRAVDVARAHDVIDIRPLNEAALTGKAAP